MNFFKRIPARVYQIGLIVGIIAGLICGAVVMASIQASHKGPNIRPENVQAMCTHLNEKWMKEGSTCHIPSVQCKARQPLKSNVPSLD